MIIAGNASIQCTKYPHSNHGLNVVLSGDNINEIPIKLFDQNLSQLRTVGSDPTQVDSESCTVLVLYIEPCDTRT